MTGEQDVYVILTPDEARVLDNKLSMIVDSNESVAANAAAKLFGEEVAEMLRAETEYTAAIRKKVRDAIDRARAEY